MLKNDWLPIKSLIVASGWSRLYLPSVHFLRNMLWHPNLATFLRVFIKQWREANFSFVVSVFLASLLRRLYCRVSTTWLPCKKFKSSLWLTATTPERFEQNTYSSGCSCIIKCLQIVYKYCVFIIQQLQTWRRCGILVLYPAHLSQNLWIISFSPRMID